MHLKVCIVILAAAYIAYADEQFLDTFDEDEDVEDIVSRVRRESEQYKEFAQEYFKHIAYCCNETEIRFLGKEHKENLTKLGNECVETIQNETDIRENQFCIYECIFEIMNVTDESGNVVEDPEKLNKLKILYRIDQETILQNIASKCPAWSKEAAENVEGQYDCNPQSLYFWYCAFDMRNLYCPAELRYKDERCDEHYQNLTKAYQ